MTNQAVFLDRDGTINKDVGYLSDPEKLNLLPRVAETIKMLNGAGFKVIIVSNQSGVARGFFSEEVVNEINTKLERELLKKEAFVDGTYFCPHHPEIGTPPYRKNCNCRKPKPGLLLQAAKDHEIELSRSYTVGDEIKDIEAGVRAGCKTVLVLTGKERDMPKRDWNVRPDYIAKNLHDAACWILSKEKAK